MAWTGHTRGSKRIELGPHRGVDAPFPRQSSLVESGDQTRSMAALAGSGDKTCLVGRVYSIARYLELAC